MVAKQTKIDKDQLPLVNKDNQYIARFRVVSNRTQISDWSQLYYVDAIPVILVNGVGSFNNNLITIVWENTNNIKNYDVFIKWDNGSYTYYGTTSSTSYTVIAKAGTSAASVVIQAASVDQQISAKLRVYEKSLTYTLV